MGRLLHMKEVSDRLNTPIETLRRWRKTNLGPPSFLVGGGVRYDEDELNAWIQAQRAESLAGEAVGS